MQYAVANKQVSSFSDGSGTYPVKNGVVEMPEASAAGLIDTGQIVPIAPVEKKTKLDPEKEK